MTRWFRTVLPVAAGIVLLACAMVPLLTAGEAAGEERAAPSSGPPAVAGTTGGLLATGTQAPAFLLPAAEGEEFSYGGGAKRSPLLLVFFSVFCDPCRAVLPVVQRIRAKYGDRGLEVVCVSLDGRPLGKTVAAFARQEGYTFRILLDEVNEHRRFRVADAYRVTEVPVLYLVDGGGRIAMSREGRVGEVDLDKVLQTILQP